MSTYAYALVNENELKEKKRDFQKLNIDDENILLDIKCEHGDSRKYFRELHTLLSADDTLYIRYYYDLGDNYEDMLNEWVIITKSYRVDVIMLDAPTVDTRKYKDVMGSYVSDSVTEFLAFAAAEERNAFKQRKEHQMKGIEEARARGVKFGKPRTPLSEEFYRVCDRYLANEISGIKAAEKLGMNKVTFYRRAERYRAEKEAVMNGNIEE